MRSKAEIVKYLNDRDVYVSGGVLCLVPAMMQKLYEWGECDTWNLTMGCQPHVNSALRAVCRAGLAVNKGRHAYISSSGVTFMTPGTLFD